MNKAHSSINWENYPSDETPLNERNLNKMDSAIEIIDDRVIALDATKAAKTEVAALVADVTFEESTGIFTITKKNGSQITIDTKMEKIAVNFTYNPTTQQIILTLIDGTKQYIDLSALITQYEFLDTDTVAFIIGTDGKVSAIVIELADFCLEKEEVSISVFREDAYSPLDKNNLTTYCGGYGEMLAFDPEGKAYPCLRYMKTSLGADASPVVIGDMDCVYESDEAKSTLRAMKAITRKTENTVKCFECPIASGCAECAAWNY